MSDYAHLMLPAYTFVQSGVCFYILAKLQKSLQKCEQLEIDQKADADLMRFLSQENQAIRQASRQLLTNLKGYTQTNQQAITGHALHDLLGAEIFQLEQAIAGRFSYVANDPD